jgi:hypothetical protein
LILLVFSCHSIPDVQNIFSRDVVSIPLERGASVYLLADARQARSIINLLPFDELNDDNARQILDRTDFLAAAVYPPQSGRRFHIAGWGNYPNTGAGFAFTFNREWNRLRSAGGSQYWHSGANRLSIALDSRQVFAVASINDEPRDPKVNRDLDFPAGFNDFRHSDENVFISGWAGDPSVVVSRVLNEIGVPIRFPVQEFFFVILPSASQESEETRYEAILKMRFENTTYARGTASLLNLAGGFSSSLDTANDTVLLISMLFLANRPVQNDRDINIRTAPLTGNQISLLLEMFSLY